MFAKREGIERDIYHEIYKEHVLDTLEPAKVWEELHQIGEKPVILCHEDLSIPGEWCHRRMVADWFTEHGYGDIAEWEKKVKQKPKPLIF